MIPLGENYTPPPVTDRDREISLILWGFSLGFGFLTCWKAYKQTMKVNPKCRLRSVYVWLIWIDLLGSFGFGIGAWFFMQGHVKAGWVFPNNSLWVLVIEILIDEDRFPLFLIIVLSWTLQIQSQLQIIINRLSIIWVDKKRASLVRWGVFALILCVNIAVGSIWIPTALQISPTYVPHPTLPH